MALPLLSANSTAWLSPNIGNIKLCLIPTASHVARKHQTKVQNWNLGCSTMSPPALFHTLIIWTAKNHWWFSTRYSHFLSSPICGSHSSWSQNHQTHHKGFVPTHWVNSVCAARWCRAQDIRIAIERSRVQRCHLNLQVTITTGHLLSRHVNHIHLPLSPSQEAT